MIAKSLMFLNTKNNRVYVLIYCTRNSALNSKLDSIIQTGISEIGFVFSIDLLSFIFWGQLFKAGLALILG